MERALEGHRRYLTAMRTASAHNPRAHAHQLAALDRELALAAAADDIATYRAASGDAFELTRAAWLDRAANAARVAAALGDPWRARAAALDYAHALGATGPADWTDHLAAGSAASAAVRARGGEATAAFAYLLSSLVAAHGTASTAQRADYLSYARHAYDTLREADPGFAWSGLSRLPPYRLRTPWTDVGLAALGGWLAELGVSGDPATPADEPADPLAEIQAGEQRWLSELGVRPPGEPAPEESVVGDVLRPYRELADSLGEDDRASAATRRAAAALVAAGAGAATGQDALADLVEQGLLVELAAAPLRARAEEGLARQDVWPDPLVEQHWRALGDALEAVRTPTEVELVSIHAEGCLAIEADWNRLLLGTLLAPLRAACTYGWLGGEEARAGVARAAETTRALLGLGPRSLIGVPRAADFVSRIVFPLAGDDSRVAVALEGEGGFDLLAEAGAWVTVMGGTGADQPRDAAQMAAALLELLDRAGVAERGTEPLPVALWGETVEPAELVAALARPRRPAIPGIEAVARAASGL